MTVVTVFSHDGAVSEISSPSSRPSREERKNLEVLFETSKDGYSYGHTTNYLHVKTIGLVKSGEFRNVKIINVEYPYAFGELLDDEDQL